MYATYSELIRKKTLRERERAHANGAKRKQPVNQVLQSLFLRLV